MTMYKHWQEYEKIEILRFLKINIIHLMRNAFDLSF